jgi:hypothetical protein
MVGGTEHKRQVGGGIDMTRQKISTDAALAITLTLAAIITAGLVWVILS